MKCHSFLFQIIKIRTSNLASPRAATAQDGGSIIGGGAGALSCFAEAMVSCETCLGRLDLVDNIPAAVLLSDDDAEEQEDDDRERLFAIPLFGQKWPFICDLGIEPQSDTFTVIFILTDIGFEVEDLFK